MRSPRSCKNLAPQGERWLNERPEPAGGTAGRDLTKLDAAGGRHGPVSPYQKICSRQTAQKTAAQAEYRRAGQAGKGGAHMTHSDGVWMDYLEDLLLPAFNAARAMHGIEPAPPKR
jgi:hypothetical protein